VFPDNGDGVLVSVVDWLGVSVRTRPGVGRVSFMAVENGLGKVGLARETEGVFFLWKQM
jgi:hypothetical protein